MANYYIRTDKKNGLNTIYFNVHKRKPNLNIRVCTHIQIGSYTWSVATKSIAAWNKFAQSEIGKPIVEKLDLMQQAVAKLIAEGKVQSNDDKDIIDKAILSIINAGVEKLQEEQQVRIQKAKERHQQEILAFYDSFLTGIVTGSIRHGNGKTYAKTTIDNWRGFKKYLYDYTKPSDIFDDVDKAYADGFLAHLENQGLLPTTCNIYIICFRKLCNIAAEYGVNHNATSLKVWKERDVKDSDKRAEIYLTDEELDAIYTFPLNGFEEQARDLFILGCLTCQRYSDYGSLSKENFCTTASGTPIIKVQQQKTGNIVEIPVVDTRIGELCEKYDYDFPKIDDRHINDYLLSAMKKVAMVCPSLMEKCVTTMTLPEQRKEEHYKELLKRKADGEHFGKEDTRTLNHMMEYALIHKGKPLYERNNRGQVVKFKYELITTHTARRSGVTNLYKTGLLDTRDMMAISGHQTEKVFEHYIKMSKSEHADRIAAKLMKTR